jgi:hypothetical protein
MSNKIRERLAALGWTLVHAQPEAEAVDRRDGSGNPLEVVTRAAHYRAERNVNGRVRSLGAASLEDLLEQAEAGGA